MSSVLPPLETAETKKVALLPAERIVRLTGYGMRQHADGYLFRPTSVDEIRGILDLAREAGRKITLRGAGRSYGDGNIGSESILIDIGRMRRILSWDPVAGLIDCEAGVTIEGLWRHTIEDGYWPPVVSGTMYPTLAGALAMNIHGKNNFRVGTLGEQVMDMDVLFPTGELRTLTPADEAFHAVISGAGLLGIIVRVRLRMKRVSSGDLDVLAVSPRNWDEQFAQFERDEPTADYMVSWVDCFARGKEAGRGQYHGAWYVKGGGDFSKTFRPEHQGPSRHDHGPRAEVDRVASAQAFLQPLRNASPQLGEGPRGAPAREPQGASAEPRRLLVPARLRAQLAQRLPAERLHPVPGLRPQGAREACVRPPDRDAAGGQARVVPGRPQAPPARSLPLQSRGGRLLPGARLQGAPRAIGRAWRRSATA